MYRWLVWNIVFPLQERAKGHATFRMLKEMEAADRFTPGELEQLRIRKLKDLIEYCYAHVPYIRTRMKEAGVGSSNIREPGDLALLPIMTKADVHGNRESLRSEVSGKLRSFSTSGSTGAPLALDFSKRRLASHVACRQRVSRWWGVSIGDPEIALWGPPLNWTYRDWLRGLRDRVMSSRLLSAYEMNEPTMSRYLDILGTGRWRQIFGYPSAVYLLCLQARKEGRNLRRSGIKVVFVTGEVLFPHQRELITETLGCLVANGYGGRDSGFVAHECPQGGLHIMADAVIVEIVDSEGGPVPPGESGEIVVTDLYSHEAPCLRYATGDMGVASSRLCSCGRPLPLLERIDGRVIDAVVAPDGRVIPGLALNPVLWRIGGIDQVRVHQKGTDCFHVQIVPNERFQKESEERIREGWAEVLRSPLRVTFEYLPDLPTDRSGKRRFIVSDIPSAKVAAGDR
jgi:phenylacetate-CoA ligase